MLRAAAKPPSWGTWTVCAVQLIFAVVLGAGPLSSATPKTLSLPLAFAAGAVLAAVADTIMPEVYEQSGPTVAPSTAAGFVLSFVLYPSTRSHKNPRTVTSVGSRRCRHTRTDKGTPRFLPDCQ